MPAPDGAPEDRPLLVFDGDCAFCTSSATWLAKRFRPGSATTASWQSLDVARLGLTVDDVQHAAWWLDVDGSTASGHLAIARGLRASHAPWPLLGWVLTVPGGSWLAARCYALVAKNRHRMPGGTAACALPAADGLAPDPAPGTPTGNRQLARLVTYGLTSAVLICSLAGLELWPLSGFRLFSAVRTADSSSYELHVTQDGRKSTLQLSALPDRDFGALQLVQRLPHMSKAEQESVVRAWLSELQSPVDSGQRVVVAQVGRRASPDWDEPPVTTGEQPIAEVTLR